MNDKDRYKVRLYDEVDKDFKHGSLDWLKQQLGIRGLEGTIGYLQRQIDELEKVVINLRLPIAVNYVKDALKKAGRLNTKQLNKIIYSQPLRIDRNTVNLAFELMVNDGTIEFEKQGKGKPRLWSLKERE